MKRKHKRSSGWVKDFLAILMFLLLFPYFAFSFKEQKEELKKNREQKEVVQATELTQEKVSTSKKILDVYAQLSQLPHNRNYFVAWEEGGLTLRLPVENFLVGALAASIPATYEEEVLKAQVVVLRSTLCEMYEKQESGSKEHCLLIGSDEGGFWTDCEMQSMWGDDYEIYAQKCVEAVAETQGIYLSCKGKAVCGFYHGMSAGGTRDAEELFGKENYSYLRQTVCTDNLSAPDFVKEKRISKEKVGSLTNRTANEEGYVISVCKNGTIISGEQLREELGIISSNVTWKEEGDDYIFMTKGRGHGFGLDQYYGNALASEGADYQEIIHYFFADVTFERME